MSLIFWRDLLLIAQLLVVVKIYPCMRERPCDFHLLSFAFGLSIDFSGLEFKFLRIYALTSVFIPSLHYEHYDSRK